MSANLLTKASIYQQVHRILRILNINLGLLDEVVVKHTRKARRPKSGLGAGEMEMGLVGYERTRRNQDVIMPELSVVAAWVVVMKLAYGLDGRERYV
jgi:RNA polymerase I-specific transcription initiation factor RRN7